MKQALASSQPGAHPPTNPPTHHPPNNHPPTHLGQRHHRQSRADVARRQRRALPQEVVGGHAAISMTQLLQALQTPPQVPRLVVGHAEGGVVRGVCEGGL